MSLALSFLGGAPFQVLYDGVKEAISTTRNFRTQLINLEFTLGCLQPRIILQISSNNVQLSLPNDIIQDLQVKMNEGVDLVARLSKLSMWNIRIWGNCCNCLKPNYAEQLEDLDRSLNRLLELLRLEQIRNVTLLMLRLDDIERTQSDILQALQDIPGYISRAQQEVIQRMQANVEQQVRNGEGRAAAPAPVVGVVFGMLFDAVTKVKVKNLMFNRLLGELKYSLDCLKPLIEEIANNNKVLHLPAPELEDFVMEMEKAVEFVRKCSKVSKRANYRKYQWTNKLLQLDEHFQRLFTDFNGQLEWKVKEVMDLVSSMEEMMNQTKGSGVVETQVVESEGRTLPQPHSLSVRLDLQNMVGTSTHVTEKTLIDTAEMPENEIYNEPPSDVAKFHVKNVQGARDVHVVKETLYYARNLEVGDIGTEGTSSTRNVEKTSELMDILKRFGGSPVRMLHNNQTEIVDQHEPPEPTVQIEVADVCETRLKGTSTHVTEKTMEPGPYPERAGEPDCPYYIRTGLCRFGARCRFNHPPNRKLAFAPARMNEGEFPERIGQPECQYYLKTGNCKFGATCKFHHPRDEAGRVAFDILNDEKTLQDELSLPILLAARVLKSAHEAESFKPECADLAHQVDRLSQMLRSAVRIAAASPSLYERPVRRVAADVTKNLDRALSLVRKCRHSGVLRQVFSITTAADFRKVSNLLESSIGDMKWLLSVLESDGANLSLPPIASNDPILSWVWSYIAAIQMGQLRDRVDAATSLVSLARDNHRNKKIIVDEGGVTPLLKLLKEGSSPEAQIAAANALFHIATDLERVRIVIDLNGVPMIVSVLADSPMRVQAVVVKLVAEMAEMDPIAQEEFSRENVTRPLVSLLAMDTVLDEPKLPVGKTSIHSLVINKELVGKGANSSCRLGSFSSNHYHSDGSSRGAVHYRKEREKEVESAEVKLQVKVGCAEALWKLCRDCLVNSRKVTETKGLICLAKIVEKEDGDLQRNCLMTLMEIAAVAESNAELRRSAFKPNSPAAKAVVDQLMRVIQEESDPDLQLPAIKAIGSLARTFPAGETRIVGPLVTRLGNENLDVATEAAIALGKFVCMENFIRVEHSKTIIEFGGVPSLMKLLKATDRTNEVAHMHCLVLLCYLALHVGNSQALEQAQVLSTLEGGARSVVAQNPALKELFSKAMHHLSLYQPGGKDPPHAKAPSASRWIR